MMKISEIELVVTEDRIDVWYRGQHYISFAIKEDGMFVVSSAELRTADIEFLRGPLVLQNLRRLDVYTMTKRPEEIMGLPRMKKRKTAPEVIQAPRATKKAPGGSADSIAERQRDKVLNAILDSLLDHPDQSNAFRAAETRRIAEKFNEPLYAVAGVRAALTRETYGDPTKLLANRRRQRSQRA